MGRVVSLAGRAVRPFVIHQPRPKRRTVRDRVDVDLLHPRRGQHGAGQEALEGEGAVVVLVLLCWVCVVLCCVFFPLCVWSDGGRKKIDIIIHTHTHTVTHPNHETHQ